MGVTLLQDNEPVIDALIQRLQDELSDAIEAINAADTKGIQLEDIAPEQILDYVPTPSELHSPPVVCVEEGPSRLADDTGWGATDESRLVVVIFVQEPDQRTLAIKLRRYRRAVRSIILHGRSMDPAWGIVDGGTRPGPTLARPDDPRQWLSYTGVILETRHEAIG